MKINLLSLVGLVSRPTLSSIGMMNLPASIGGKIRHPFDRRSMSGGVTSKEVS